MYLDEVGLFCRVFTREHRKIIKRIISARNSARRITFPVIIDTVHVSHFSARAPHGFQKDFWLKRLVTERLTDDSSHQLCDGKSLAALRSL
jgi:hypothetical protein